MKNIFHYFSSFEVGFILIYYIDISIKICKGVIILRTFIDYHLISRLTNVLESCILNKIKVIINLKKAFIQILNSIMNKNTAKRKKVVSPVNTRGDTKKRRVRTEQQNLENSSTSNANTRSHDIVKLSRGNIMDVNKLSKIQLCFKFIVLISSLISVNFSTKMSLDKFNVLNLIQKHLIKLKTIIII